MGAVQESQTTSPLADTSDDGTSTDGDPALAPLTPEEVSEVHCRVLDLPQDKRWKLTTAFREHFQVPRNARSIGDPKGWTMKPADMLYEPGQ